MPIVLRDEGDTGAARPATAPARRVPAPLDFGDDSPAPPLLSATPAQVSVPWGSRATENDGAGRPRAATSAATARRASVGAGAAVGRANRDLSSGRVSSPRGTPPQRRVSMLETPPSMSRGDAAQARRGAAAARPKSARPTAAGGGGIRSRTQSQGPPAARPATAAKDRVVVTVRKRPAKEGEKDVVFVQDGRVVQVAEPRTKVLALRCPCTALCERARIGRRWRARRHACLRACTREHICMPRTRVCMHPCVRARSRCLQKCEPCMILCTCARARACVPGGPDQVHGNALLRLPRGVRRALLQ